jgi:hypothetical protein
MQFRLLEIRVFNVGQRQGFIDLYGRWRGPDLVMEDRDRVTHLFRSGLRIEHASITLDPDNSSDFKAQCAAGPSPTAGPRTRS